MLLILSASVGICPSCSTISRTGIDSLRSADGDFGEIAKGSISCVRLSSSDADS